MSFTARVPPRIGPTGDRALSLKTQPAPTTMLQHREDRTSSIDDAEKRPAISALDFVRNALVSTALVCPLLCWVEHHRERWLPACCWFRPEMKRLVSQATATAAPADAPAVLPSRGWLRPSSAPQVFRSRRHLKKHHAKQLRLHCDAASATMTRMLDERAETRQVVDSFLAQENRSLAAPSRTWCARQNAYVLQVRRQERKVAAKRSTLGTRKKLVGAAALAQLDSMAPSGPPDMNGRCCKFDDRAGIRRVRGFYDGATGSCQCCKRPTKVIPRKWLGGDDDAYEEAMPLSEMLERELGPRARAAAAVLGYRYHTVGALRDGWNDAAVSLRRHLKDGTEVAKTIAESFHALPLRPFLSNVLDGLNWRDAAKLLKYHHKKAGDVYSGWKYCRRLLEGAAGGDAMIERLEASWLFRMHQPASKHSNGWWLNDSIGGGADIRPKSSPTNAKGRWALMRSRQRTANAFHSTDRKSKTLRAGALARPQTAAAAF